MEKLKKEIKDSGRSFKWLSEKLDIPYQTFIAYMNGYRTMPNDLEKKIKKIL